MKKSVFVIRKEATKPELVRIDQLSFQIQIKAWWDVSASFTGAPRVQ